MSEDKTKKEEANKESNNSDENSAVLKTEKMRKKEEAAKERDEKDKIMGLEELPEEIKKKLEKKQSEIKQRGKGKIIKKKKKEKVRISKGCAFIKSTYNNTVVTLTDQKGNVISWASAGMAGFKGPKKSTPYAAQIITRLAVGRAREEYGLEEVSVFVRGIGTGRDSAIRALNNNGLMVTSIKDITPIPHNGCRAKKPRRV
jgi:small subunit ribosomal protein S11